MTHAYVTRTLEGPLAKRASEYPVVVITGPRQSGKTTLARHAFPDKSYVSLEDLDERAFAESDPRGFLARFPDGAILDEIQRAPGLPSYLQRTVDDDPRPGRFILTGSQQFDLMAGISQSLAGRSALLRLLPLSCNELASAGLLERGEPVDRFLLHGFYPTVHVRPIDRSAWLGNLVRTALERDIRNLVNVRDRSDFERFLALCAGRTGNLVNLSSLGADCGITHNTAKAWLGVLEAAFVIRMLNPWSRSAGKRLVKTPKLYFTDPGLASWLLGIREPLQLAAHPLRGALFETLVVSELLKARVHNGLEPDLFFWREHNGFEVDVIREEGETLHPLEVKAAHTVPGDALAALKRWQAAAPGLKIVPGKATLVYGGSDAYDRDGVRILPWHRAAEAAMSPGRAMPSAS